MQWFKFYGADYLIDPKMAELNSSEKVCWITLLCLAASSEDGGKVAHVSESYIMRQAGIKEFSDEWNATIGVLKKFVKLDMITNDNGVITLSNWQKRQGNAMSGYERLKRYRERKRNDNGDNGDDNGKRERVEREKERNASKEAENANARELTKEEAAEKIAALKDKAYRPHKIK